MAIISCPSCLSDNDIHLGADAADGTRTFRCGECEHTWGASVAPTRSTSDRSPFEMARGRFATASMLSPERAARVVRLKRQFLKNEPLPTPEVDEHRARFQHLFSAEVLATCDPQDLKDFATSSIGGETGTASIYSRAWNKLGADEAAERTRESIDYLLRGPDDIPLEDRLTHLIEEDVDTAMPGFKEPLLTKVLCVVYPERFLPLFTYTAEGTGKREITESVFGLHLPVKHDATAMQIGRLAVWSNDLLLELVGDGFTGTHHAAAFLLWAKDRAGARPLTSVR
jgi:hypothetical protein